MKKMVIAVAVVGLLAAPAFAQVNQGQGGAPSAKSGGTIENPRTRADQGANSGKKISKSAPKATTGAAPAGGNNRAQGSAGKSGGEGGSGR